MPYQTLILNTHNFASSQFLQHIANSSTLFNGKLLFTNNQGLFSADPESTEKINAHIYLPRHDLGYVGYKTPRALIIGCKCDGVIRVDVTDEKGITKAYYSKILEGEDGCKIGLDSDQRSRYFIIKVSNVDGSYFSLSSIDMIFIPGPERTILSNTALTTFSYPTALIEGSDV